MKRMTKLVFAGLTLAFLAGCHGPSSQAKTEPRRLKLVAVDGQSLKCGSKSDFTVHVEKEFCRDAEVCICIEGLPKGVRVEEISRKVEEEEMYVKYNISADMDAELVTNYHATVTAESQDGLKAQGALIVTVKKGEPR